jgi:hypothetical protein
LRPATSLRLGFDGGLRNAGRGVWRLVLRVLSAAIVVLALSTISVSAAAREPIVIGMIAPLTGPTSAVGSGHRLGAEAAVSELQKLRRRAERDQARIAELEDLIRDRLGPDATIELD